MLGAGVICLLIGLQGAYMYGIWQAVVSAALTGVAILAGNMFVMSIMNDGDMERLLRNLRRVKWIVGIGALVTLSLLGAEVVKYGPGA